MLFQSTIAYADTNPTKELQQESNTLELNHGRNQHVSAHTLQTSDGNKTFQSKLTVPGISITEQIKQRTDGNSIQENKIVVNVAQNQSVQFIQQFDGQGRKLSRSVIRRSLSQRELNFAIIENKNYKNIIATEGGKKDLAIEQKETFNTKDKYITTTVRSDNFSLLSGTKNWMLIVSAGYEHFNDAMSSDGYTGVARIALNRLLLRSGKFDFGLEASIQNGINMRPVVQQDVLSALGGTPILATIKPVIELLPTVSKRFSDTSPFVGFVKFGAAYRLMTFDRDTIPNISKISPDLHLGVAYTVSEHINLMMYYNIIFGGSPDITATMLPLPANNQGKAANIPTQQGVLLGFSFSF
jgi:hypothetical protein